LWLLFLVLVLPILYHVTLRSLQIIPACDCLQFMEILMSGKPGYEESL